jgi:hypothetical protein
VRFQAATFCYSGLSMSVNGYLFAKKWSPECQIGKNNFPTWLDFQLLKGE